MNNIPIVLIVTCAVIGLCALSGLLMGFVRKISGIVSFVLACVLVGILLPTITSALRTTPVYTAILTQCEAIGNNIARNSIVEALSTDAAGGTVDAASVAAAVTADDGSGKLDRNKIKAQLQQRGYDPSIIDSMSDADLESYAQQLIGATAGALIPAFRTFLPALTVSVPEMSSPDAAGQGTSLLSQLTSDMDKSEQIRFIEDLPIPEALKDQMETFNNAAGYVKLGASDFGSYVVSYMANLILNILAFLVTLLISWILIRLILGALSVFASLPVIGGIDRILGLAAGIVQGILIVWALFLILSLFSTTPAGKNLMDEISRTPILQTLYNSNLLMNTISGAFKGIL